LFGLNIYMQIESEQDFQQLEQQIARWRNQFPMFKHDVLQIEKIVRSHIQAHSKLMVMYRQSHSRSYLEKAQLEIDAINRTILTVEKIELMAILSQ